MLDWRRTAYAIPDQRVAVQQRDANETPTLNMVRTVSLKRKSSSVLFDRVPPPRAPRSGHPVSNENRLARFGVPAAPAVFSYAQSASQFYRLRNQPRSIRQGFTVSSLAGKISCAHCGGQIDLATVNPESPRCPRRSAVRTDAPTGM